MMQFDNPYLPTGMGNMRPGGVFGGGMNSPMGGGHMMAMRDPGATSNPAATGGGAALNNSAFLASLQQAWPAVQQSAPQLPYSMTPVARQPIGGMWNQQAQQMAGPMFNNMVQQNGFTGQPPQGQPQQFQGGGGGVISQLPIMGLASLGGGA